MREKRPAHLLPLALPVQLLRAQLAIPSPRAPGHSCSRPPCAYYLAARAPASTCARLCLCLRSPGPIVRAPVGTRVYSRRPTHESTPPTRESTPPTRGRTRRSPSTCLPCALTFRASHACPLRHRPCSTRLRRAGVSLVPAPASCPRQPRAHACLMPAPASCPRLPRARACLVPASASCLRQPRAHAAFPIVADLPQHFQD